MLVTLAHYLIPDWLAAGRIISVATSVLAVVPFFALARRCSPGWPAIWVSLIFIFIPEFNTIGFAAIRDPLFVCLALTCLFSSVLVPYIVGYYSWYIYSGFIEVRYLLMPAIILLFGVGLTIKPFA